MKFRHLTGTIAAMLSLLLFSACSTPQKAAYQQITMEQAIEWINGQTDYLIVDVRTQQEYTEQHIPGAINIPNESISDQEIPQLPDKEQVLLVYCRSGNRSKQASQKLADLGYINVKEFGGIQDWPGETVSGLA